MAARVADGPLRDLVFSGRTVLIDEAKTMGLIDEKCPSGMLLDRAMEVAQKLASIPAGAFALTKEAFYTPILERARQLADLNARVVDAWLQQHTYDTIRAYLDKTIRKIIRNPRSEIRDLAIPRPSRGSTAPAHADRGCPNRSGATGDRSTFRAPCASCPASPECQGTAGCASDRLRRAAAESAHTRTWTGFTSRRDDRSTPRTSAPCP